MWKIKSKKCKTQAFSLVSDLALMYMCVCVYVCVREKVCDFVYTRVLVFY